MSGYRREPSLSGLEASWSGLAIAEAILLGGRSAESLKVAGCFATATFAIARASALWPQFTIGNILARYEECNRLIRGSAVPNSVVQRLEPIWHSLIEVSRNNMNQHHEITRIVSSLRAAREDRNSDDHHVILSGLDQPSEFGFLSHLETMGPEERVALFDHLIRELSAADAARREIIAFIAGYMTTIAAGGLPSLSLAQQVSNECPEVLAWAYVIGGIGERVTWSSSFHGLGRLVWRELVRPFHMDESPACDFGFDEASYLTDKQLNDPLVHLKIKQQRLISAAILPGVNINIPLTESQDVRTAAAVRGMSGRSSKELSRLVNDLWPLIEARLSEEGYLHDQEKSRLSSQRRRGGQGRLPLK